MTDRQHFATSADAMKYLDARLRSVVRSLGYKRARGTKLAYAKPSGRDDEFVVFGAVASRVGYDHFAGGLFRVELGLAPVPELFAAARVGLVDLLSESDLERYVGISRAVVAALPRPPDVHVEQFASTARDWYAKRFEPPARGLRRTFYEWAPFRSSDDLDAWSAFLAESLPSGLDRVARSSVDAGNLRLAPG
ncbi:hypothetical protein [Sandaracinus amylolyticus]|uniref:hypothetical protein n=1 Tax=Sandaracinus amylolyticus TaxID=927083 RepID=UPI001F387D64|nr:hypothetical protein [Sandaracinus amylolyticus]UJR78746.1 Hypothetical protein I5071_7770 [Sandaracinus amylolyticus]